MKRIALITFCTLLSLQLTAQTKTSEFIYKKIDTTALKMKIYYPDQYKEGKKYPAIVLFYGGGWNSGSISQFINQAIHLSSKGMIVVTPEYRIKNKHKTTPFESVKDGRSAIRYVRENATKLGIDPNKIAAGGGSAGGHVAAATDLTQIDEATDHLSVSARPNALVLFNPVFNNGPGNYGYERFKDRYTEISPYHNIKKGAAPAAVFLGTNDKLIPVETAKQYEAKMKEAGSRCDLFLYEGQGHGFFNFRENRDKKYYEEVLNEATKFLQSLAYIK